MEKRIVIRAQGGPEVLECESFDPGEPGPGEVLMRHTAIGLNFIDIGQRGGSYPIGLPTGLGMEAAGFVEQVGPGVTNLAAGDRVCTFGPLPGTYATARTVPAALLFRTPDAISDELAAAALLKACTAEFLIERCARVEPGQAVLVHAAAGGVGLMLVQWLKHIGATVIGTVSTSAKAEIARAAGADHVVLYTQEDAGQRVRELTDGEGVRVTFDGVGAATWQASLTATGRRGMIVNYGAASSALESINPGELLLRGSLYNARPALYDYYLTPEERSAGSARVFDLLERGVIEAIIGQRYRLDEVARAHAELEGRRTIGSGLLLP